MMKLDDGLLDPLLVPCLSQPKLAHFRSCRSLSLPSFVDVLWLNMLHVVSG